MPEEIKPEANTVNRVLSIISLILVLLFLILFLSMCYDCTHWDSTSTSTQYTAKSVSINEHIIIPYLILGTTEANWDRLVTYAARNQQSEMINMAASGGAFIVEDYTEAIVLETSSLHMIKVKILSGKHTGKIGWLSREVL